MTELVELPSGILVPKTEFIPDEKNKFKPTLHEIRDISLILAEEIKHSRLPITKIVGVSRGGITPMDPFTRTLGIQDTDVFAVAFYTPNPRGHEDGQDPEILREEPLIFHEPSFGRENEDGHKVLFVEDLTDTGKTGRLIRAKWPRATVGLFTCKSS
jgi:hypoxanthine phosphoribosyltransferase